jgi:hypothetical protein
MTRGFHHLLSGCLLAAFVASTGVGQAQTQPDRRW